MQIKLFIFIALITYMELQSHLINSPKTSFTSPNRVSIKQLVVGDIFYMENYCVYLHRTKIKNIPFYVGKGKISRAKTKFGRNSFWNKTAKKYGYNVEYLHFGLSENEALNLEKYYISLYGKRVDNSGTLVNLTDGGEGVCGLKRNTKLIHSYNLNGTFLRSFNSIKDCICFYNVNKTSASLCLSGVIKKTKNGIRFSLFKFDELPKILPKERSNFSKYVLLKSVNSEETFTFISVKKAAEFLKVTPDHISEYHIKYPEKPIKGFLIYYMNRKSGIYKINK